MTKALSEPGLKGDVSDLVRTSLKNLQLKSNSVLIYGTFSHKPIYRFNKIPIERPENVL